MIGGATLARHRVALAAAGAAVALTAVLSGPVVMFASGGLLAVSGTSCTGASSAAEAQPAASQSARNSIPAG